MAVAFNDENNDDDNTNMHAIQPLPPEQRNLGNPALDRARARSYLGVVSESGAGADKAFSEQRKRRASKQFSALTLISAEEEEEIAATSFPTDVFSMMFFANPRSLPFIYGLMVFSLQMIIVLVIFIDLTTSDDRRPGEGPDQNYLNVPADVNTQVRVAQVIAILIAGLSNTDVTRSLEILSVGWKPFLQELCPDAKPAKFVITNFMRIAEGSCVIVTSFIFILQSTTVIDIFLNFAAVQFVASLDDLGYQLAREGWLGRSMKHFNASIEDVRIPAEKKKIDWLLIVKPTLVVFVLACLYATFAGIAIRQSTGKIIENTSCGTVHVVFGEHVYPFSEDDNYALVTTSAAHLVASYNIRSDRDFRRIVGSNRILGLGFNASKPPDLHYSYFSGTYKANFNDLESSRPSYYENGVEDFTAGQFYYCKTERSWVFTIRAFVATGAIPDANLKRCKHGWLMRSPVTDAFTLDEAPFDGWKVWTGVLELVTEFSVTCTECDTDLDCGTKSRGTCENNQCQCLPGVADNYFCQDDVSCDDILVFKGANPNRQGEIYPGGNDLQKTFRNVRGLVEGNPKIHGRPVYYLRKWSPEIMGLQFEVIFYTGRRWYGAYFTEEEFPIEADSRDAKVHFFLDFHAYWNNVLVSNAKWISEPTKNFMPTGPIKWYGFHESLSMGNYGAFPARRVYSQRLECYSVDCNVFQVCGEDAQCMRRHSIFESDGYELEGNECVCDPMFEGHFCEFCVNEGCRKPPRPPRPPNGGQEEIPESNETAITPLSVPYTSNNNTASNSTTYNPDV